MRDEADRITGRYASSQNQRVSRRVLDRDSFLTRSEQFDIRSQWRLFWTTPRGARPAMECMSWDIPRHDGRTAAGFAAIQERLEFLHDLWTFDREIRRFTGIGGEVEKLAGCIWGSFRDDERL